MATSEIETQGGLAPLGLHLAQVGGGLAQDLVPIRSHLLPNAFELAMEVMYNGLQYIDERGEWR